MSSWRPGQSPTHEDSIAFSEEAGIFMLADGAQTAVNALLQATLNLSGPDNVSMLLPGPMESGG